MKSIIPMHRDLSTHFQADMARDKNILGRKIAAARKALHLTQPQLSNLLTHFGVNVKTPAVNKWECGDTVPNAYQLMALCHALRIESGLDYFTGPITPKKEVLNPAGLKMLESYREYLESNPKYRVDYRVATITMPISLLPASAGLGDFLDEENFEKKEFPAGAVPEGADFGIAVDGDSMEPLFQNGQIVWIHLTPQLNVGDVGLFVINDHGFIKTYAERLPAVEDREDYMDSDGLLHPQVALISQNEKYEPKVITPEMNFRIVGRVLR